MSTTSSLETSATQPELRQPKTKGFTPEGFQKHWRIRSFVGKDPYEVLGVTQNSSWEEIKAKFGAAQSLFSTALVAEMPPVGQERALQVAESQAQLTKAFEQLQEQRWNREGYLEEAKNIPSLLRRFETLLEQGQSFPATDSESLFSAAGTHRAITDLIRDIISDPETAVSPYKLLQISDLHHERSLLEKEIPQIRQVFRELKQTSDVAVAGRLLKFLIILGYEKLPTIREGKRSLNLHEELQVIQYVIAEKGEHFSTAALGTLKRKLGMEKQPTS